MNEQATDHDSIVTLIGAVKTLEKSQDDFRQEMKGEFKDLKCNYAVRIEALEKCAIENKNIFLAKIEQKEMNETLDKRLGVLEKISYIGLGLLTALQLYFHYLT